MEASANVNVSVFSSLIQRQYESLDRVVKASESALLKIEKIAVCVVEVLREGGKILTAGNGGSAADALHMAEEFVGRYAKNRVSLPALALCADGTALTCIANDYGFEDVFARQVEGLGRKGDALIIFSTSGNSKNLLLALQVAKRKGLKTIAFLGKQGGMCAGHADLEWIVPSEMTARIQEMHTWALHCILECVDAVYE
ncbi:MAG: SIS domain-containing protein [Methylacidiphilales bacterium]|nr:SIS domain-containing protein [Candidatus Methylacidiphilales bacterium]MDW8349358.1 SIS domain-containing protein [Verrucomicrobiae bacterium]